jgi:hypothetical protein
MPLEEYINMDGKDLIEEELIPKGPRKLKQLFVVLDRLLQLQ